jgi:hypothetical protein
MRRLLLVAVVAMSALTGCGAVGGVEGLVAELRARGLPAEVGGAFDGTLLGGDGTTVCIGDQSVAVYAFRDPAAAAAAADTINRDDPSNIGNGLVEWIGPPRFWLRDRLIVNYVGDDAALDAALRAAFGLPFAEAKGWAGGRRPLLKGTCR